MQLEKFCIDNMIKGWFIGNFEPSLFKTNDVEVGVKRYKAGDYESLHHHKIATEFTVIIEGRAEMNGQLYQSGDIIKIQPGVSSDFRALTSTITVIVKIPGAQNDKFIDIK